MTNRRNYLAIAPLLIVGLLSGCQGGGSGSAAQVSSVGVQDTAAAPSPANTNGNSDLITLALRYVSYADANGALVIDQAKAQQIVDRTNQIYAPCNIRFAIEEFIPASASTLGLPYGLTSMDQLEPTRSQFDVTDKLVVINTGNWDHGTMGAANAWTTMPGSFPPGAVLEAQVADNAEIVAHELGHYLNLDHVSDTSNLLSPIVYTTSTQLTSEQCETMRQSAVDSWSAVRR